MARLMTCRAPLVAVMSRVVLRYDCTILCGRRSRAEQDEAFRGGFSKVEWPDSKHNVENPAALANAVDAIPYPINWNDLAGIRHFAGFVLGVASEVEPGVIFRWGGDWDRDRDLNDQTFNDLVHFEIMVE
mgnify:FL=1|jgi:peptidoglycan L-alanyl-D-glutamate endopeptidase CwlK|tara:strand:+ start:1025 stop:1414 length:390 start_codon:yes stop_codon:yes gene_type:complete